ncbi:MAG: cyclophilin-like fold protein [Anaerolineales bacterium]|jgi:hypothetical protein
MDREILISAGDVAAFARLFENETARVIWEALPLNGIAHRWGEEIYFDIPVVIPESDDARQEMRIGELAYWPAGNAFCIFFGRTPISEGQTPKAYANVNPFGIIEQNAGVFTAINDGAQITISRRGKTS